MMIKGDNDAGQVLGSSCGSSLASWSLNLPQVTIFTPWNQPFPINIWTSTFCQNYVNVYRTFSHKHLNIVLPQLDIQVPYQPPQPPPPDVARAKVTNHSPNKIPDTHEMTAVQTLPFLQVLHLSDLHVQLGYKEGEAKTCGKYPVCCLPGLGVILTIVNFYRY